jgi:hypothetical protein
MLMYASLLCMWLGGFVFGYMAAGGFSEEPEPAAPSGLIVIRDGAPAWCLDPAEPRGDQWYESCAEPSR